MFPSAALLADIACPLFSGGCCERPYCLYKHTKEDSSGLAEAATGKGVTSGQSLHNQEESNTCLLELEKINKQIEAVRNEVEKEQKRLFRYQSEQTEITRASADTAEQYVKSKPTVSKDLNGNRVKSKKTAAAPHSHPSAQKYVVPKMAETEASANPPPVQKKRVAHVAKFEQVSKSKAQVIVPLRDGGSQLPVPTRSQQCQKRAAALTAAVKGCQQVIAASVPRKVFIHQWIFVFSAYVNILPVGTTLRLGSNLHLIVPDGNCALPVTLIPATLPVTRPLHQPAQNLQPAQPANYTPAKLKSADYFCVFLFLRLLLSFYLQSIPTKRKAKVRDVGVKVPHDVRQRYVNLFVEEFLKTSATVQDAFEKALAEEKTVFDRSINKLKYLSVAVNALKRLKNQNAAPAKFSSERDAQASRGNVPLNTQALLGNGDLALYDQLKEHILTEAMLRENNYPRRHPDKAGAAVQYGGEAKKGAGDGGCSK
uniref:RNA exonuclease 1 homolog-like domain-containing protein n=1 Tax=Astyanax mexicanus TaxID=7994 RepID=A0A8B9GPC1_ASTMX